MVGKTPVSLLHEMCTRKNITPKYDLLQVEGAVHEPIFQYRLTLDYNGQTYEGTPVFINDSRLSDYGHVLM